MKSTQKTISNPTRTAILRSILSRENASFLSQIQVDVPGPSYELLRYHIKMLLRYKILSSYEQGQGYERRGVVFMINPDGPDDLQDAIEPLYHHEENE